MSEREWRRSEREARRDLDSHPERPNVHEDELLRHLGAEAYAQLRRDEAPAPAAPQEMAPPGRVTVAVDDSAGSVAAVDQAAAEASLRGWEVRLVHVQAAAGGADSRGRATALLARLADRARTQTNSAVSIELCQGSTVETLVEQSADSGLIVMGSRGMGPLQQIVAGSTSTRVAANARSPVVVVPASSTRPDQQHRMSIVVGVDGSPESAAAAEFAADEARLRHLPLTAIHAMTATPSDADALTTDVLDPARSIGVEVDRQSIPAGAAQALVDASTQASLVVVGTRGGDGVRGVRLGSTSQALLRHSHCPVAVVSPAATRRTA